MTRFDVCRTLLLRSTLPASLANHEPLCPTFALYLVMKTFVKNDVKLTLKRDFKPIYLFLV